MTVPRLVMASGTAPGAGKSTLVSNVAAALGPVGGAVVVTEDDVWGQRRVDGGPVDYATARAEFVELLHSDRPRTADALLRTFDRLATTIAAEWWLQDWTWHSLCGLFAEGDRLELNDAISVRLAAHRAVVLYLQVDARVSLRRAVKARGETWFVGHAGGLGLGGADVEEVADFYVRRERAHRRTLADSGVSVIVLDGGRPVDLLVDDAMSALSE